MNKYRYKGEVLTEKELLAKLLKDNVTESVEDNYVKLYVYVFDKDKMFVKKDIYNVLPHNNGSVSFKMDVDDFKVTKNITKDKLSTIESIKCYKCKGYYRKVYEGCIEEADTRHIWHGKEDYVDGKLRGEKFSRRDDYKYYYTTLGECNGVWGERYEVYSLEPLEKVKCYTQVISHQENLN
jgi:hypothetical protein